MSRHSFEDAQAAYLAGLLVRRKLRSGVRRHRRRLVVESFPADGPRHDTGRYRAADIIERERQTRKRAALMARYSGYVGGQFSAGDEPAAVPFWDGHGWRL